MQFVCVVRIDENVDQEMLCHEQVGSWRWLICDGMSREVHTYLLSCGDTSEVRSYVPCSQLRDVACGEVRSWWITCVGLRAGRSVE